MSRLLGVIGRRSYCFPSGITRLELRYDACFYEFQQTATKEMEFVLKHRLHEARPIDRFVWHEWKHLRRSTELEAADRALLNARIGVKIEE